MGSGPSALVTYPQFLSSHFLPVGDQQEQSSGGKDTALHETDDSSVLYSRVCLF